MVGHHFRELHGVHEYLLSVVISLRSSGNRSRHDDAVSLALDCHLVFNTPSVSDRHPSNQCHHNFDWHCISHGSIPTPSKCFVERNGTQLSFSPRLCFDDSIYRQCWSNLHPLTKAQLMSGGALIVILVIWLPTILPVHHLITGIQWGGITSFFAMLLPLTCFSFFMPHLSLGIGPIISSLELPSSVVFAFILLGEAVTISQIVGVCLIILAVILSNILPFRLHGQYQQMRP